MIKQFWKELKKGAIMSENNFVREFGRNAKCIENDKLVHYKNFYVNTKNNRISILYSKKWKNNDEYLALVKHKPEIESFYGSSLDWNFDIKRKAYQKIEAVISVGKITNLTWNVNINRILLHLVRFHTALSKYMIENSEVKSNEKKVDDTKIYLYLKYQTRAGLSIVKIGMTSNILRRMRAFKTTDPNLKIKAIWNHNPELLGSQCEKGIKEVAKMYANEYESEVFKFTNEKLKDFINDVSLMFKRVEIPEELNK